MINIPTLFKRSSGTDRINAKVELYDDSTLVTTCTCDDRLQDFVIERMGQGNKFFGFGIFHKITINFIDLERTLEIVKGNSFKVYFTYNNDFVNFYPTFYAADIQRDENTNTITVIAYDKLYEATEGTINDLILEPPYTIRDITKACSDYLGISEAVLGKNLWDNANYETYIAEENITKTDTGFIFTRGDSTGGRSVNAYIQAKAGETYTFSYDVVGDGRLYIYKDRVYGTILVSTEQPSVTYTFEEDTAAVFTIIINNNLTSLEASNIQIEKNSIRTSYEPYISAFDTSFESGANFEGTELCKDVFTSVAEATQTIYFLNYEDKLIFKRLDITGDPVLTITKEDYYDFATAETHVLATITNTNELNDATSSTIGEGVTQFVRNNPFWELNDNLPVLLDNAIAAVAGTSITPFFCEWDGNVLLEIGDKIGITREDDTIATSYVFNDVITYDGSLSESTSWTAEDQTESAENPTSLGDTIKQTFAKVDKANKEITLLVSDVAADKADISSLKVTTEAITSSVSSLQTTTTTIENNLGALVENIESLEKTVSTKLTASDFDIKVTEKLSSGVDEIAISETGFKFDKTGLTITKTDSEMSTNVDEDGLSVYKNNEEVLTVDNAGVRAKNLHATTYLIVGNNTYFSDFIAQNSEERAGCFWTGK